MNASDARLLFEYLSEADEPASCVESPGARDNRSACDAVIGFGMFDLRIAETCGALLTAGCARRIIFTGGIGAGSADLGRPEADAFADALALSHPQIPRDSVIVENQSTNTGENVRFTLALLARAHPELTPGAGLRTALLVASPARLRRVRLTWRQLVPNVGARGLAPRSTFADEAACHAAKGIDYLALLIGEIARLQTYPAKGWIAAEPIPPAVLDARGRLLAR